MKENIDLSGKFMSLEYMINEWYVKYYEMSCLVTTLSSL